ncbi:hypothetical protein GGF32_009633 [Allomyces javanicus]|nr:hypothetical protein GGF32_009633 [Allomyces javanicus]
MTGLPTAPSAAANAVAPHPGATTRVTTMPDGPWRALRGAPPVLALDAYVPAADAKGKWAKREVRFDGRLLVCLDTTKHKAEFAMDAPVATIGGTVPDSALVLKRSSPLMATPEHGWEYWTAPVAHDEDSSDDTSLGDVLATPVHLVAKHFQVPLWTMPVSAMAGVRVLVPPSSSLPAAKRWRHPLTVAIDARYGRSQVLRPKSEADLHVLLYALQTAILAANAAKPVAVPTESDRARAHRRGSPSPPRPRPVATGHQRTGSSSRSQQPPPRPRIWHWATVHGSPPLDAPQPDLRFFPICERDYPTAAINARRQMPFRLAVSIPPPRMFQGAKPQPLKNKSVSTNKPKPVPEPEPEPAVAAPKPAAAVGGGSVRTTPVLAPVALVGTGSLPASTSTTPRPAAGGGAARPRLHVPQLAVLPPSAVPLASPPHAATPPDAPAVEPAAQQMPPSLSLHLPPPLAVDDLDPSALYSQLMLLSPLLAEKRLSTLILGKPPSPSFPVASAPGSPAAAGAQADFLALPLPPPIPASASDELAGSDLPPRTVSLVAMSPRPRVQRRTGSPIARPRPLLEAAAAAASGGRGVPSIATSVHELLREGSEVGADISVILQLWQALGMPGTVGRAAAAAEGDAAPREDGGS